MERLVRLSAILLLGWTTMTLAGLIYSIFPKVAKSILCRIQFVLFNIGLPIMMIGLTFYLLGHISVLVVSIGMNITALAILIFAINIFTSLKRIPEFHDK